MGGVRLTVEFEAAAPLAETLECAVILDFQLYSRTNSMKDLREVDHVVERAVLCDSDEHRLVVRGRVDRAHAVEAGVETTRNVGSDDTVRRRLVDTLHRRFNPSAFVR